ncbi:MAG: hypothetical protein WCC97_03245 [Candidatus Acidiferrales bacterium]
MKTKSPLDDEAVSGLEIRFRGLLKDSDSTPALAVGGTTTRRTEAGLGAAIHDVKSYLEWMRMQRERFIEGARLGGAGSARRLAALMLADCAFSFS